MKLHPPLHLGVVAIEKGTFGSPSTKTKMVYLVVLWLTDWFKPHINPSMIITCFEVRNHVRIYIFFFAFYETYIFAYGPIEWE